jgi:hypothetical protein
MPTPYWPASGSVIPIAAVTFWKNLCGNILPTATSAPMVEIEQNRQTLFDNFVGLMAVHLDDKTDTTGIMLELRII